MALVFTLLIFIKKKLNTLYLYAYIASLVEIFAEFKKKFLNKYINNKAWVKIIIILNKKNIRGENAAKLFFARKSDGLIYKLENSTKNYAY